MRLWYGINLQSLPCGIAGVGNDGIALVKAPEDLHLGPIIPPHRDRLQVNRVIRPNHGHLGSIRAHNQGVAGNQQRRNGAFANCPHVP